MYLNKAMIYGNLTRDPEMKALPSGMQVCSFSVATNRSYNDRDGKRQEAVEYHNVTSFGKQAEVIAKYLTKGSGVYVEGRLQTNSWEKDGVKQYRTEIVVDKFEFGPKSGGGNGGGSTASAGAGAGASNTGGNNNSAPVLPEYPTEDINPEDIPF
jgi:single-strand DNA-binding protein